MKRFLVLIVGLFFLCSTVAFAEEAATTAPAPDSTKAAPAMTKKAPKKAVKKASKKAAKKPAKKAPKKDEKKDTDTPPAK